MMNINTKSYWDNRFVSGDWEQKSGRNQTQQFANSQILELNIDRDFSGTILDFGCGLGDAFPIYRIAYPNAKLIGLDISEEAIKKCKETYGNLGEFICGDHLAVPVVDIIIASNVFEHLSNDSEIAIELKKRCKILFIIVPYSEELSLDNEHVNSYNENSFNSFLNKTFKIFKSKGWSEYGFDLYFNIHLKNIAKYFLGRPIRKRRKQIIFQFK
jgi:SAM-dependent methyltransferase